MLTINGIKFAENTRELVNSVFCVGGSASGTFKRHKNGILLYRGNGELFAYVVNNRYNEQFIVTAYTDKTTNRTRYMYALTSKDERFLGLDKISYGEGRNIAKQAIKDAYNTI